MFGGQSCVDLDNALAKYIPITRIEIEKELQDIKQYVPEDVFNSTVESKLDKEIKQAAQNVMYNLNTMHSRAGQ